ncbi:MAG: hypothetical protein WDA16_08820 [Candidatus Thermoplasmatota archaeon]
MLVKLESSAAGARPHIQVSLVEARCPFIMHFAVLKGTPSNAVSTNSVTMNFAKGQGGMQIYSETGTADPISVGNTEPGWSESCHVAGSYGITFGALPVGSSYFLMAAAGGPVRATATLTAPATVRVDSISAGTETFFRGMNDFEGGTHVVASSPPTCTSPSLSAPGSCDPCCLQPSGGLGGADVSIDRRTQFEFRHHPYFSLSTAAGALGASNVTVTTPLGDVLSNADGSIVYLQGMGIITDGIAVHRTAGFPPGVYELAIHQNANARDVAAPGWYAWGADVWFPEENIVK